MPRCLLSVCYSLPNNCSSKALSLRFTFFFLFRRRSFSSMSECVFYFFLFKELKRLFSVLNNSWMELVGCCECDSAAPPQEAAKAARATLYLGVVRCFSLRRINFLLRSSSSDVCSLSVRFLIVCDNVLKKLTQAQRGAVSRVCVCDFFAFCLCIFVLQRDRSSKS